MKRLLGFRRRLGRRFRIGVELMATVAFVVEACLERLGDPGLGFIA